MKFKIFGVLFALVLIGSLYADEISYDDGNPYGMSSNSSGCPGYFAVKCGPIASMQKCQVNSVKSMTHVWQGDAQTCSAFVWTDNGGLPGNLMDSKDFTPIKDSVANWVQADFFTGAVFLPGSYFWVGVWMAPDDGTNINLICSDQGLNHTGGNAGKSTSQGWTILTEGQGDWQLYGDLMIRAVVQYIAVEEGGVDASKVLTLNQNSPNPVVNATVISYSIPQSGIVSLKIYDITGKLVRSLVNGVQKNGVNETVWDKRNDNCEKVNSGAYFYRLSVNGKTITKVMTVL